MMGACVKDERRGGALGEHDTRFAEQCGGTLCEYDTWFADPPLNSGGLYRSAIEPLMVGGERHSGADPIPP